MLCTWSQNYRALAQDRKRRLWHMVHVNVPFDPFLILFLEEAFDQLPQSTVPEMQRSNLAPVILQLKALGIDNVLRFHFMSVSLASD